MTIAEYTNEEIDTSAPFTVVTTYCTGRKSVQYPETISAAVRNYTSAILLGVKGTNVNIVGQDPDQEVHVRTTELIQRDQDGFVKSIIDPGFFTCGC